MSAEPEKPLLNYAGPPAHRAAAGELVVGILGLISGIVLLALGLIVGIVVGRRMSLADRVVPIFVMCGAGALGVVVGLRMLRRYRRLQD